MADQAFNGFPKETLTFLKGLSANNSKAWFDEHRADYDTYYVAPARDFVAAIGPKLQKILPGVQFAPKINGSIFRINRDVRFSNDKTPYKDHLDMWFWVGERKGWDKPGFYFRLTPTGVIAGAGMHRFERSQADKFRQAVVDDKAGKALLKAIKDATSAGPYALGEPSRKTVPRGYDKDHPRAALLLHDGLTVGLETKLPKSLHSAAFVEEYVAHLKAMSPIAKWLLKHVSDGGS